MDCHKSGRGNPLLPDIFSVRNSAKIKNNNFYYFFEKRLDNRFSICYNETTKR